MKTGFNLLPFAFRRLLVAIGIILWISIFVWTISEQMEFLAIMIMPTFYTLLYGVLVAIGLWIYEGFIKS